MGKAIENETIGFEFKGIAGGNRWFDEKYTAKKLNRSRSSWHHGRYTLRAKLCFFFIQHVFPQTGMNALLL
jgi:hypothetical protein